MASKSETPPTRSGVSRNSCGGCFLDPLTLSLTLQQASPNRAGGAVANGTV
jgi:hypothetical protein